MPIYIWRGCGRRPFTIQRGLYCTAVALVVARRVMEPSVEDAQVDHGEQEEIAAADCSSTAPLSKIGLKAGMQGLDKAKVNRIIFEATKGSRFHDNELRKDEQIAKKIKSMMERVDKVTAAQIANSLKIVDKEIEILERTRDLSHVIVHIDMDAFYAAVEMRDNSQLRNVPMAVGGIGMLVSGNGSHGLSRQIWTPPFLFPPVHIFRNIWTPRPLYFRSIWTPVEKCGPPMQALLL